jgi:WD40 repeat protein
VLPKGPTPEYRSPDAEAAPTIPDYELIRIIGRGSYGDIWLARGLTGTFRAIKVVWRHRFPDARPYEREFKGLTEFAAVSLTEFRQLALLHVGRAASADYFYYVMELADDAATGREIDPERYVPLTLQKLRDDRGRLPAKECVALGVDLSRALSGLHERKLVHRDIKPSNVVFVGGVPKLADIGLVAAASDSQTFIGTEGFVPPEGPGAPSADVYALGKLLYELSTGLDRREYPRLPANLQEIPDRAQLLELNEVIVRACNPVSSERHSDASGLLSELLLLQAGKSVRRLRLAERQLGRALRAAVVFAIIAGIAGSGAWIERTQLTRETERRRIAESALAALARKTSYLSGVDSAQRAIEVGNLGAARRTLQSVVPKPGEEDLRNVEWYATRSDTTGDPAEILLDHGPSITGLSLSGDGRILAAEDIENEASLWDLKSLGRLGTIREVRRVAGFSGDGRWILGSDSRFALGRWATVGGARDPVQEQGFVHDVVGRTGPECILAVTVSQEMALIGIRVWNSASHRDAFHASPVPGVESPWKYFNAGAVSPDGSRAALVFMNYAAHPYTWRIQVYDLGHFRLERSEDLAHPVSSLCLSNGNELLAYSTYDTNDTVMEDASTGHQLWKRTYATGGVTALAFSSDDRLMAIGGRNRLIHIVSPASGQELNALRGQGGTVLSLAWAPSAAVLYSAGDDGDIRRWSTPATPSRMQVSGLTSAPLESTDACLSDDGSLFAASFGVNQIRIGPTGSAPRSADINIASSIPLAFDRAGTHLLALDLRGRLSSWDLSGRPTPIVDLYLDTPGANLVAGDISGNQERLVASDSDGNIYFYDLKNRREISRQPGHHGNIWWNVISPKGDVAVSAGENRSIRVWSMATGVQLSEWLSDVRPFAAAFSSDGSLLAIGFSTGAAEIRDAKTLKVMRRWQTQSSSIRTLAFSHDGKRLVCGTVSGGVAVYDTQDWSPIGNLYTGPVEPGNDPTVYCLRFNRTSSVLLAFRKDGVIRFWHLTD